jgi:hypothetical protein
VAADLEGSHVCKRKLWAGQREFYSDNQQVPYARIDTDVDAIGISLNECACSIGRLWESRFRNKQEGCCNISI